MMTEPASPPARPVVRISSVLGEAYRTALEELLFFNPGQERLTAGIEESIARHGVPDIVTESGELQIRVGPLGRVQALFAMESAGERNDLVGVIIYCRLSLEELVILHVAVNERFASTGPRAHAGVVLRLFQTVRGVAARLKGVRTILMYQSEGPFRCHVGAAPRLSSVGG
jgi:hypothetical protein